MNTSDRLLGFQFGMTNEQHHATSAVGSSQFKDLERSPLHYWQAHVNPARERRQPTEAMRIGTAWHAAVFEPQSFAREYVRIPDGLDRRTKEGKALWEEITGSGREPLAGQTYDNIVAMAVAARRHPVTDVLMGLEYQCETSLFWVDGDTGVWCKARPDMLVAPCDLFPHGAVIDGKTTEDAGIDAFGRQVWNYRYYYQAAFYIDGVQQAWCADRPPVFLWLAQEKEAPFATRYLAASDDLIEYGRRRYREHLRTVARGQEAGVWPGYPETIGTLAMPAWVDRVIGEGAE